MVDEHALAAEGEVRVAVRAARAPAAPRLRPLLGDPDHDDAEAALALGGLEVGASDVLLALPLGEADERDGMLARVALQRLRVRTADPAEDRGRGDGEAAVEQEADHLPLAHQAGLIGVQEETVDRADVERHVVAQ